MAKRAIRDGFRWAAAAGAAALLFLSASSHACSRKGGPPTMAESAQEAEEIFIAHLVSAKEQHWHVGGDEADETLVEGSYVVKERLKGNSKTKGVIHDVPFGPGNCSLGLMVGWDYLFMVSRNKEFPVLRWIGLYSGSFPLGPYRDVHGKEENELTELREILKKQSEDRQK